MRVSARPWETLVTDAAMAVMSTTSRLVPRASVNEEPTSNTRAGTMMIPPPTPSRAAMTPAISPMITKRAHGSSALLIGGPNSGGNTSR